MDCILSTNFAREQYFWKIYFVHVGLVAYEAMNVLLARSSSNSVYRNYNL